MHQALKACLALVLLAVVVTAAQADPVVPYRLADGAELPAGADFTPAEPPSPWAMIPRFSPELLASGIGGHFEGDAVVSENGKVLEIRVLKIMHPRFDREIARHVRRIKFRPATLDGKPVASLYRVIIDHCPDGCS